MRMTHVQIVLEAWKKEADELVQRYGAEALSTLTKQHINELEKALKQDFDEPLTLRQAARISGFTDDYLGRLIRQGKLTNIGRKNAPRVRRGELPAKIPTPAPRPAPVVPISAAVPVDVEPEVVQSTPQRHGGRRPGARADAIEAGLKTYHSDRLCPRNHDSPRRTRDSMCLACHREANRTKGAKQRKLIQVLKLAGLL